MTPDMLFWTLVILLGVAVLARIIVARTRPAARKVCPACKKRAQPGGTKCVYCGKLLPKG